MRMIRTSIYLKVFKKLSSHRTLGKHSLYGRFHREGRFFSDHIAELFNLQSAGISGMPVIKLIFSLVSADFNLTCVNNNYKIAQFMIWDKFWFMLSSEKLNGFNGDSSEPLSFGVNNPPFSLCIFSGLRKSYPSVCL